jgi:uncharacterized protein (DUF2461 family)
VGTHPPFRGWPPDALDWFAGIEKHNDREWFQANRDTYEQAVRQPFLSLLAEVAGEFGDAPRSRSRSRGRSWRPSWPSWRKPSCP